MEVGRSARTNYPPLADVLREVGLSRRVLESRFRRLIGRTPHEEILRVPIGRIKERPWVGPGFSLSARGLLSSSAATILGEHYLAHFNAASSNWHNLWLGTAADFGIPAAILMGCILFQAVRSIWWVATRTEEGTFMHTLALMLFVYVTMTIVFSWTFGHSTGTLWKVIWMFGLGLGMKYTMQAEAAAVKETVEGRQTAAAAPGKFQPRPAAPTA